MLYHLRKSLTATSIVLAMLLAHGQPAAAQTIAEAIQAAQRIPALRSANIGFYAINLTQEKVLYGHRESTSLIPASTLKLVTTATALEVLGPDFRCETHLQYSGTVDDQGVLQGNIYIRGGGDPALGSLRFKHQYYKPYFIHTWVKAIQGLGIRKVAGAIVGDAQVYTDNTALGTWILNDMGKHYGTVVSGLSIFDNIFTAKFRPTAPGQLATLHAIIPSLPADLQLTHQVEIDDKIRYPWLHASGYPYILARHIQGQIPHKPSISHVKVSMPDPAYWAATTLHTALQQQGIEIEQPATTLRRGHTAATVRHHLHTLHSPQLQALIRVTNHDSINRYAEHLIKQLSLAQTGTGSTPQGIKLLKKFWRQQGIDTTGMLLYDGSGLSRYNAVTPRQLVQVLSYMYRSQYYAVFYDSLPIGGKTGSVAPFFRQAPLLKGRLKVKLGRLDKCKAFAGYTTNMAGDDIAFALLVNHYDGTDVVDAAMEEILTALVQQE